MRYVCVSLPCCSLDLVVNQTSGEGLSFVWRTPVQACKKLPTNLLS